MHGVCLTVGKENVYEFLDPAYTNLVGPKSSETQAYITNTLEKEEKQIYLCPYINDKFNYMSSIIIILCFKYLLTLFMDDIGIIGSYLSYQWLIRLLCGSVPYTRRFPQNLRISMIRKYIINLTLYMLLINHSSWRGYNILKGRSSSNNLN